MRISLIAILALLKGCLINSDLPGLSTSGTCKHKHLWKISTILSETRRDIWAERWGIEQPGAHKIKSRADPTKIEYFVGSTLKQAKIDIKIHYIFFIAYLNVDKISGSWIWIEGTSWGICSVFFSKWKLSHKDFHKILLVWVEKKIKD